MEDLFATLIGFFVVGGIILLFTMWIVTLIRLIIGKSKAFKYWLSLTPEKRKNNRKMNRTVKRIKGKSKYGSSYGDGGSGATYYSSGDSESGGDGGGGCD
ncbi:hypothetical protein [Ureibacillus manganicus]|uniref:Uncharacterized protein n=1 Tax=Ureibacillus manganicus DSM 26584 TaxID=1384049 RepID=A0A0A3IV23_9BACL|nr:hypothetical protein [Ureibacillus manganicus]KGR78682.1 hypothetical protein CD29_09905 [Ureibacillus manganicus DSM 26584]